ncbi:hypothetical protein AAV94_09815 [Lampropedia cohaerens]|uniref:Uncharacterized protein n=1 Tax=Lampropedia cohaerens TaxID=1610491 RepID=A0A0U1PYH7_9BURK|nr:hypothetical protein [Lampropedia cohaerens]KKW67574.1 hypothetical protein AAV94_09815 [Lampropedia cohaerens]
MEIAFVIVVLVLAWMVVRARYQAQRIVLLGKHLSGLQVERHMETLTQGYLRAIREKDVNRQNQIWETFAASECGVAGQIERLAEAVAREPQEHTRIARWAMCVPYVERFLPAVTRDFRQLLRLHAQGVREIVENPSGLSPKDRAYQLSAELFLLQHSCHWFCKSRAVADARLIARHQVDHGKVLASVSERTRNAYLHWLGST